MPRDILPRSLLQNYEVHEWRHATAVLAMDFPEELKDIIKVLGAFTLKRSAIIVGGGGKSKVAQEIDSGFYKRGWAERHFDTKITVGDESRASPTHSVDCFKNGIALEIEWSNKDPFFDRDLNNFRLLFDLRVASVGVIITKSDELRSTFTDLGIWNKYGTSTTWMHRLLPRIAGGGGGGCPLLVFGITNRLYRADQ